MVKAARKAGAVAMALSIATAAACGGNGRLSKAAYQQKLKAEAAQLRSEVSGVNLQTTDLRALAATLGGLSAKLQHSADDIGRLKPPRDAEADNRTIAAALHRFAALLKSIQQAASSGDKQAVQQLSTQVREIGTLGSSATKDLQRKGYDIGGFGA